MLLCKAAFGLKLNWSSSAAMGNNAAHNLFKAELDKECEDVLSMGTETAQQSKPQK
jgi:3-hydroxy-3-methylglutaryl CoA synthase